MSNNLVSCGKEYERAKKKGWVYVHIATGKADRQEPNSPGEGVTECGHESSGALAGYQLMCPDCYKAHKEGGHEGESDVIRRARAIAGGANE